MADDLHKRDNAARESQRARQREQSVDQPAERDWLNDPAGEPRNAAPVRDSTGRDDTDAMRRQSRR